MPHSHCLERNLETFHFPPFSAPCDCSRLRFGHLIIYTFKDWRSKWFIQFNEHWCVPYLYIIFIFLIIIIYIYKISTPVFQFPINEVSLVWLMKSSIRNHIYKDTPLLEFYQSPQLPNQYGILYKNWKPNDKQVEGKVCISERVISPLLSCIYHPDLI